MNSTVVRDWAGVALSAAFVCFVFMDTGDAKEVLIHMIDALKEYAIAAIGNC